MLTLNFSADSDLEDFNDAIKEYQDIWKKDGEKIVTTWEKVTSLKFNESHIDAKVFRGMSFSHPLSLRFNLPFERKKSVLIHELGHRILYKRRKILTDSLERHKFLFLVLYEVYVGLYGEDFAKETIEWDSNLPGDMYKKAWQWVLKFSPEERKEKFKEMLNS